MTFRQVKRIFGFIVLPASVILILAASHFRILDNYELETLDYRFLLRPKLPTTDKIALIEIGDDTIEKFGRFPFDRSYHALLIKALSEAGAKKIVFDIFFSEPHPNDKELEYAMRRAKNVYLPFVLDIEPPAKGGVYEARGYAAKTLDNLTLLAKGNGHINIMPDIDGKSRRIPLYIKYKGRLKPYLSFMVACGMLGISQNDVKFSPGRCARLPNGTDIPLDEDSEMLVNFAGKWGKTYKHYSYVDIVNSYLSGAVGQKPPLDMSAFKGKICIVGLTGTGTVDLRPTPLESLYPGVGIHAEVINSILNKKFIVRATRAVNTAILAVLTALLFFVVLKTRPKKGLAILILAVLAFGAVSIALFDIFGIWIDVFLPVATMMILYLSITFYKYIAEWKSRLVFESELDIAKKIQESFLPKKLPSAEGIEMAAAMYTARKVGGDLYDVMEFGNRRIAVMIGDVSGKGIPASLFMAMAAAKFKFFAAPDSPPQDVLFNLNASLVRDSGTNLFVTMYYMIFDLENGLIRYANGGHLPAAHIGLEGGVEFLDVEEGTPLGLMDGPYSGKELRINKGDTFVLYTDGVTEAMNPKGDMYGKERLAACIEAHKGFSSQGLLIEIEKDIRKFEPKTKQHDDMMIIVVKI